MPQHPILRITAWVGASMAVIAALSLIFGLMWNSREDHLLNQRWYQDDLAWNSEILERQADIERKLDLLNKGVEDGEKRFDDLREDIRDIRRSLP